MPQDSIVLLEELRAETLRFLDASKAAWVSSTAVRRTALNGGPQDVAAGDVRRYRNTHCHREDIRRFEANPIFEQVPGAIIRSVFSTFSVCPDWILQSAIDRSDVSGNSDIALMPPWRASVPAARLVLLERLDVGARTLPDNEWLTGQRVRFRIEAGQFDLAAAVADRCSASRSFCLLLQGYVQYRRGAALRADSLFSAAMLSMSTTQRCRWGSIEDLLPREARARYAELSCAARDSVQQAAWWLADPLFVERGNARRVEHFARAVRLSLHTALPRDDRWDFQEVKGGDAIVFMLRRYGWPTRLRHGGTQLDASHDVYLQSDAIAPYSAPEYARPRLATLPSIDAILDPFTVQDEDYVLTPPRTVADDRWWPVEHFDWGGRTLTTFAPGQTALLRRDSSVLFAVASTLTSIGLATRQGEVVPVSLVLSPSPDSAYVVNRQLAPLARGVVLRGSIASGVALAGIEMPTTRGSMIAARSRFGIVAPPTLSAMAAGELAVSEPVLFDPAGLEALGLEEVDDILDVMHPTIVLAGAKRVGVYWESYGFRVGDTVTVTVQISVVTEESRLRGFGMTFRVLGDPNGIVSAQWTEPRPDRSSRVLPARIPVLTRQLTLDISNFREGTYRLQLSMQKRGSITVNSHRIFQVLK